MTNVVSHPNFVRGIRGATVAENDTDAILDATETLLAEMIRANDVRLEDIASALFTVTPDLTAAFPAAAARRMGWAYVPLLNFTEIDVQGGMPHCIRVLLHVNTSVAQAAIAHIYLGAAAALRPDLPKPPGTALENS